MNEFGKRYKVAKQKPQKDSEVLVTKNCSFKVVFNLCVKGGGVWMAVKWLTS
jgi:hypothetical protein